MNVIDFNQAGGFPLTTNILNAMQNAYKVFNALGNLAGDNTIISGCEKTGSNVADGVVFFNGEVLPFKGGTETSKVRLVETTESKQFEDGNNRVVVYNRYITFGTGVNAVNWRDFKKPTPLVSMMLKIERLEKKCAVFAGTGTGMVFWNKPANLIPDGWQEVTDWRGRFPVGFDAYQSEFNTLGKTGGEKKHRLTISEMPSHNHGYVASTGSHASEPRSGSRHLRAFPPVQKTTDNKGGNQPHNNLPPYRVVLFIEYIG